MSGPKKGDNLTEGGMTAFHNAMATRNGFLTTAKALNRALRQAEFDVPATDSAPFYSHDVKRAQAAPPEV